MPNNARPPAPTARPTHPPPTLFAERTFRSPCIGASYRLSLPLVRHRPAVFRNGPFAALLPDPHIPHHSYAIDPPVFLNVPIAPIVQGPIYTHHSDAIDPTVPETDLSRPTNMGRMYPHRS